LPEPESQPVVPSMRELSERIEALALTPYEVWVHYIGVGDLLDPLEVEAYLSGALVASEHTRSVFAHMVWELETFGSGTRPRALPERTEPAEQGAMDAWTSARLLCAQAEAAMSAARREHGRSLELRQAAVRYRMP
jgi:hypothetical protein